MSSTISLLNDDMEDTLHQSLNSILELGQHHSRTSLYLCLSQEELQAGAFTKEKTELIV